MKLWTLSQAPKDGGVGGGGRSVCSQASQKETGAEEKQRQCLVEANTGCSLSWRQSYLAWSWSQLPLLLFQEAWHFDWNWVESGKGEIKASGLQAWSEGRATSQRWPYKTCELSIFYLSTKHVSFLLIYFLHVSCLKTTFYLSTAQIKQKLRKMPNTAKKRVKNTQDSHQNHRTYLSRYIWKQLGNCDPSFDWILQI